MSRHLRAIAKITSESVRDWYKDRRFELGAALAYYAVFALAPTLVIAVAIAGHFFGKEAAQGEAIQLMQRISGSAVAEAVAETLAHIHLRRSGVPATLASTAAILIGVSALFGQVRSALNVVWDVQPKPGRGIWINIRKRLLAFLLVLFASGMLIFALAVQSAVAFVSSVLSERTFLKNAQLWEASGWLLSMVLLTLLFALTYKLLPDVIIAWHNVWLGAVVTAILIVLGNYAIGLYLEHRAIASVYGAAGSLVVVMIWVYYSSQVFLLGAELTQKFSSYMGEPIRPADYAVRTWRRFDMHRQPGKNTCE